VAASIDYILKCEDADLEEKLYQPFTVEMDVFGEPQIHELVPDGATMYVSQENKHEYAYLLIDFIFNQHCEEQFKAFKRGFYKVVASDIIEIFTPEELELLICGSKKLDFKELESTTQYVDGYKEDSNIAKWLWEIIHEDMSEAQ
jgi:ubiquitin-protein ligase E3 A